MESKEAAPSSPLLTLTIKFSGRSIPISIPPNSTVKALKAHLQPITNVLARGQKLIFKGKVLADDASLESSDVKNGSKIMLMAAEGLYQGDGPNKKPVSAAVARELARPAVDAQPVSVPIPKTQLQRWKITGVIALSECRLTVIPDEVWACGSSARLLDLSKNYIREIPFIISTLSSLQKLTLNVNDIVDEAFSWEGVKLLKSLTVLSLCQNYLTTIPSSLGSLTSLRELNVANNKITNLPVEIGLLSHLQVLKANNNRINVVPSCIGSCASLIEIDLSSNLLVDLPDTIGNLKNLKALHLRHNGLKALPSTIFKFCSKLATLDLHGTEITMELLRQFEGWGDFDDRRRSKLQKQLDFSVGFSGGFDEGADKD